MSNDGIIKRPENNQLPFPVHDANEQLWELAGVTPQMRADLLREAFATTKASLRAVKKDRASWRGQFTDEKQQPDHNARLRAVQESQSLAGLDKINKEAKPTVQLNIITPAWAIQGSPKIIPAEAKPAEPMPGHGTRHD